MTKHILLTGGVGFSASHFVEHILKETDFSLTIIDRLTYAGNMNRLAQMDCWERERSRVNFVYHDFRSPIIGNVRDMVLTKHPDYIVHAGAETHVQRSIDYPALFVESNVMGTVNMLELARIANPDKFLYYGTDEVYGPVKLGYLHKEGEPHNPSNPYAASKSGAEAFCRAFAKTYAVPVIISNTMNMFGERQEVEKFIPKTLRAIFCNQPVVLHASMEGTKIIEVSSRCWLHARNQAAGVLFLLERGAIGECYNVVGEWATVEDIADKIARILNKSYKKKWIDFHNHNPAHDLHYGLDGNKMKSMGWVPPYSLDESLERTVKWTIQNPIWM